MAPVSAGGGPTNPVEAEWTVETQIFLLREARVLERVDISRRTLWRWVQAGQFPEPVAVGPNAVRWRSDQLDEWLAARKPGRVRRPDLGRSRNG